MVGQTSTRLPPIKRVTHRRPPPPLRNTLAEFRQRMLAIGVGAAAIWGAVLFAAVMAAWVWVDLVFALPPGLRLSAWGLALVLALATSGWMVRRTWKSAQDVWLAHRMDQVAATGGEIRSGLDLTARRSSLPAADAMELSKGLAELAVIRASRLARAVREDRVVPAGPLLKACGGLAAAAVLSLASAVSLPRMAWTEILRFFDPFGDHPAYTPYEFEVTPVRARVVYGERLEVMATVRGPAVEQVDLVLIPSAMARTKDAEATRPLDVLPMFSEPSGAWRASIANVTEPFDFYLRVRRGRSQAYPVEVITVPEIRDIRVEIAPPLYTGLAVYRGRVPVKGIAGLPGTQVRITAHSNRPLSGGTVHVEMGATRTSVAMTREADPQVVTGEFIVAGPGRLILKVTDEAGQDSTTSPSIPIQLLEDQRPLVRLVQPRAFSFATPTANLPVIAAAEDDYGLLHAELFRNLNDSRYLSTSLDLPAGMPRRASLATVLPLEQYRLQPGDEIKLFARVEDNDPHGPAESVGKGAESSVVTVRIISQQDFERMQQTRAGMQMLMNKYQEAQRRMEKLAAEMEKLNKELEKQSQGSEQAAPTEEIREQLQKLAEQLQSEAEAIQKLSETPLGLEADRELSPQLQQIAELLKEMSQQTGAMSSNPKLSAKELQEQMQQLLERLEQQRQRHQQDALEPLEHLRQVLPLKQAEAAFVRLAQRQRQLAERLASLQNYEGQDDPAKKARMRDFEEEQRKIREELRDLLDRIDEQAAALPEDERLEQLRETAREFAKAVRESDAGDEMLRAEDSLSRFSGSQGHHSADRAADILEQFLSKCQGMGGQCKDCLPKFSPGLGACLQQTLDQLAPGMGTAGFGMGAAGAGGYSSQASTLENVGLYGGLPFMEALGMQGGMDSSTAAAGTLTDAFRDKSAQDTSGFQTHQSDPAIGGAEWGVPVQYRRPTGRYLQWLADELDK